MPAEIFAGPVIVTTEATPVWLFTVLHGIVGTSEGQIMMREISERLLSEPTTGVPRRMALGALFVLVTLFSVIFKALTWAGMDAAGMLVVGIYCACVAAGQAILFQGHRPRDASVIVGSIAMPLIVLARGILSYFRLDASLGDLFMTLWLAACSLLIAPLVGYLVGIFLAGGFLLFEQWTVRNQTQNTPEGTALPITDGQVFNILYRAPTWLQNHPLLLAFAMFMTFSVLVGLPLLSLAPPPMIPRIFFTYATIAIAGIAAFLCGLIHLNRSSLWLVLPSIMGGWFLCDDLYQLHFIRVFPFGQLRIVVLLSVGFYALCLLAVLGWLQYLLILMRFRSTALPTRGIVIACLTLTAITFFSCHREASRRANSLAEQSLSQAEELGIHVNYAFSSLGIPAIPPVLESMQLHDEVPNGDLHRLDNALLSLYRDVDLSSLRYVWLNPAKGLTDVGFRAFDQQRILYVTIRAADTTPDLFERMDCSIANLDLSYTNTNDKTLADLAANSEQCRIMQSLVLQKTNVTDDGLKHLQHFTILNRLQLTGCAITGEGFVGHPSNPTSMRLGLGGTQLNDAGLAAVIDAYPAVFHIDISDTLVTMEGLEALVAVKSLAEIVLGKNQFPTEFLRQLKDNHEDLDFDYPR